MQAISPAANPPVIRSNFFFQLCCFLFRFASSFPTKASSFSPAVSSQLPLFLTVSCLYDIFPVPLIWGPRCARVFFFRSGRVWPYHSRPVSQWMILVNALTIIANTRRNTQISKEESSRLGSLIVTRRELNPRFQFRFPSDTLLDPDSALSNGNGTLPADIRTKHTRPRLERLGLCIDLCLHLHHRYGGIIIGLDCQQIRRTSVRLRTAYAELLLAIASRSTSRIFIRLDCRSCTYALACHVTLTSPLGPSQTINC